MSTTVADPSLAIDIQVQIFSESNRVFRFGWHFASLALGQLSISVPVDSHCPAVGNKIGGACTFEHCTAFHPIARPQHLPAIDFRLAAATAPQDLPSANSCMRRIRSLRKLLSDLRFCHFFPHAQTEKLDGNSPLCQVSRLSRSEEHT